MPIPVKLYNLARMTVSAVGSSPGVGQGTFTLSAAVSGFISFANAGVANGEIVRYAAREGAKSEIGFGTYTSAGTTLTRNVINSTNSNALEVFTTAAEVAITPAAEDIYEGLAPPTGRLTLVSATPVLNSSQTAKNTIYYTPYVGLGGLTPDSHGPWVPSYNGTYSTMDDCGGEKTFILDTTNHLNGNNYDLFWDDAGSRLVTGPAWTNATTRSAALAYKNGFLTNAASMTGRISNNGGTTTIAISRGLYLGSLRTTANGQTGMDLTPAAASGGTANVLGLYNAYNKANVTAICRDSVVSYTYNTLTWRNRNGNANNSIAYLDGLGDVVVQAIGQAYIRIASSVAAGGHHGVARDWTSGQPDFEQYIGDTNSPSWNVDYSSTLVAFFQPSIGQHTIYALEWADRTGTLTWYGTGISSDAATPLRTLQLNMLM